MRIAFCVFVLTLHAWTAASAQFRVQTQVGAELELDRRFSVMVAERAIWGEGILSPGRYRTLLEARAQPTRYFAYSIGYQMYLEGNQRGRVLRHRLQADIRVRHEVSRLRLSYRLRVQSTGGDARRWRASLRNRVQADVELARHLRAFGSAELYANLGEAALAVMRTEWGLEYALSDLQLMLGYRYNAPWQIPGVPYHMLMLSAEYAWDFDL